MATFQAFTSFDGGQCKPIHECDQTVAKAAAAAAAAQGRTLIASLPDHLVPVAAHHAWISTDGVIYTDDGKDKPIDQHNQTIDQSTAVAEAIRAFRGDSPVPSPYILKDDVVIHNFHDDDTDPAHNSHLDIPCEGGRHHIEQMVDTMSCNVRTFGWFGRRTCQRSFPYATNYHCTMRNCSLRWEESAEATDCGRHGNGPKTYGWDGKGTWDGSWDSKY